MRIVFVDTTLIGPTIGGAQLFLPKILSGLKYSGHEIHLVTGGTPDAKVSKSLVDLNINIHSKKWAKQPIPEIVAPSFAQWINSLNPDVYVISVSPDIAWLALPYLKPQIATISIFHTDAPTFYDPARYYSSYLTKLVGVSTFICENISTSIDIGEINVAWIPYGVINSDLPPIPDYTRKVNLVYVGRFEELQKRISDLALIIHRLNDLKIEYKFRLVGDGPDMAKFCSGFSEEIESGKIEILGWLNEDKVQEVLRQSEIFILTSAYEGFCIALLEAMANGCCPLVTDIRSGNSQLVVSDKTGFLFQIGEVDSFVDKISQLISDKIYLLTLRKNAWNVGKKYNVANMVKKYEELFYQAVNAATCNPRTYKPDFPVMPSCRSRCPLWLRKLKHKISF